MINNNKIYEYEKFFYNVNGEKLVDDIYSAILDIENEPNYENNDNTDLLMILEGLKEGMEEIERLIQIIKNDYM